MKISDAAVLLAMSAILGGVPSAFSIVQTWQDFYIEEEAEGGDVIALFQFMKGSEKEDSSNNKHTLSLHGQSTFLSDGKFEACLHTPYREESVRQGATVASHPSFSPEGAFAVEMWIRPGEQPEGTRLAYLLDTMAISYEHKDSNVECKTGFMLLLEHRSDAKSRLVARLGFGRGEHLANYHSRFIDLEEGQWYHVAFSYDGEGRGRFFVNGERMGEGIVSGRTGIHPSTRVLAIGDRGVSNYEPFYGSIGQLRILNREFRTGMISLAESSLRTSFHRMEEVSLLFSLENETGQKLNDVRIVISIDGDEDTVLSLPSVESDEMYAFSWNVNTALRPGEYTVRVQVSSAGEVLPGGLREFPVTIVSRPLPFTMPVVMWNGGDFTFGFTHVMGQFSRSFQSEVWEQGQVIDVDLLQSHVDLLNEYLVRGMGFYDYSAPGREWSWYRSKAREYLRVNKEGEYYARENVSGLFPEVQDFAYNVGASLAHSYGKFPALQASLVHTEIRDHTEVSFHDIERKAFREYAGYDIPDDIVSKNGVHYQTMNHFPADRVVPDDDPILTFYRWFWTVGDGWNELHSAVHRGLKSTGRKDLWTWFDPAVRAPSIYGSGGEVDVIANWTYSYPDPIKIGQATDELLAMAGGAAHDQKVMKITQIIWYRFQTAPEGAVADNGYKADWEEEQPDARFITVSPDHLREAFWSKISRPIVGIMYHGWGSLVDTGEYGGYRYTHPETQEVLRELIREVVQPLGPTLVQVPDPSSDVAMLQSFTSQMYAARGTRGWSRGWGADSHLVLQYAQLQPRILYEETVLEEGLDDFLVLVMTDCDVLPESIVNAVLDFQMHGGIVVGDENLPPVIIPDILIQAYHRVNRADQDKAALQAMAQTLRLQLDGFYQWRTDSDNPEVITRLRRFGNTDYLFAVNDHREFGQYVGHHRLVMEEGLPSRAELFLDREDGFVYDLLKGRRIETSRGADGIRFVADFGPGDGGLWMVTEAPITEVRIKAPDKAKTSTAVDVEITVLDDQGEALGAVVPLRVDVLDPQGKTSEFSGYYGAENGRLQLKLEIAPNDPAGNWQVLVQELASGLNKTHSFKIENN